jgi:hypothetical protein
MLFDGRKPVGVREFFHRRDIGGRCAIRRLERRVRHMRLAAIPGGDFPDPRGKLVGLLPAHQDRDLKPLIRVRFAGGMCILIGLPDRAGQS